MAAGDPGAPAVAVHDLVKRYAKRDSNAVDGLSFAVGRGEVFGLLGPNGAGKTTTIGVLTTRVEPTSGSAEVAGVDVVRDPVAARAALAVVPQRSNLDRALTPRQNLVFHAGYHGVGKQDRHRRAQELLDRFGLGDRADEKVDFYSGGMAQRLMIARALMHAPQVMFLDEPTTGLDPQSRLFLWDQVRAMRDLGTTVVLTTHDMDEATTLADRVGIVDHGRLLALDTPAALVRGLGGEGMLELAVRLGERDGLDGAVAALAALDDVTRAEPVATAPAGPPGGAPGAVPVSRDVGRADAVRADGTHRIRLTVTGEPSTALTPVLAVLTARSAELVSVSIGEPSLEDVFIGLTGRALR